MFEWKALTFLVLTLVTLNHVLGFISTIIKATYKFAHRIRSPGQTDQELEDPTAPAEHNSTHEEVDQPLLAHDANSAATRRRTRLTRESDDLEYNM